LQFGGIADEFGAELTETDEDETDGAMAFACDAGGEGAFGTVKDEDAMKRGLAAAMFCVELVDEGSEKKEDSWISGFGPGLAKSVIVQRAGFLAVWAGSVFQSLSEPEPSKEKRPGSTGSLVPSPHPFPLRPRALSTFSMKSSIGVICGESKRNDLPLFG